MLGFGPLGSRSISGAPFQLVAVAAAMSAIGGITFGGSATSGVRVRLSAIGGFSFSGSAPGAWRQAMSATGGMAFGGSAHLIIAGKPFTTTALAEPYVTVACRVLFETTAIADNFTAQGIG